MEQPVGLGGVEVEDAVEAGGGEPLLDQDDEGLDDLLVGQIPLAEDRQDVLDPGPGRLAEDVLPPDAV